MINKWVLNNFKSIGEEKELAFRPLTIFTGANSSGKSTVLQSILLVTQTLQNKTPSKSIVLNGWFKKFGTYSDIVYGKDISKNVKIGFAIDDENETYGFHFLDNEMKLKRNFPQPPRVNRNISCVFSLSSAGKEDNLFPELEYAEYELGREKIVIHKKGEMSEAESKAYAEAIKNNVSSSDLQYTYKVESKKENFIRRRWNFSLQDGSIWDVLGVQMNHFLPESIVMYSAYEKYVKDFLSSYFYSSNRYYFFEQEIKVYNDFIPTNISELIEKLSDKYLATPEEKEKKIKNVLKRTSFKKVRDFLNKCAIDDSEKRNFITKVINNLNNVPEKVLIDRSPINHEMEFEVISDFFKNRINYLGPLREEPKALYPLINDVSVTEVGLKGENTAAVYENNKNNDIEYIEPTSFEIVSHSQMTKKTVRLSEAVNSWLVYLGVADEVKTNDKGKFGHELKISTGKLEQDLTHVGVGVSQVLPILVMCLLAKEGDTIILEQPELHLHPKVQARLADFFISMNALGKQCIVETHSEYMINRLRLLVAKSDDTKISNDTMIYFVEKDKENGCSKYREITINPYGKIDKWPEGFFDESEDLASQIIEAAYEKKRREKMA